MRKHVRLAFVLAVNQSLRGCVAEEMESPDPAAPRYLEDFELGGTFETSTYAVSMEEALRFARAYDPQPFHLEAAAASKGLFGRLVISGWHTTAITMRLIVDSGVLREIGVIGTGIDELRWLAPVEAGAVLFVRATVIELVPRPGKTRGTLRVKLQTIDQNGITVLSQIANLIVPHRPHP